MQPKPKTESFLSVGFSFSLSPTPEKETRVGEGGVESSVPDDDAQFASRPFGDRLQGLRLCSRVRLTRASGWIPRPIYEKRV